MTGNANVKIGFRLVERALLTVFNLAHDLSRYSTVKSPRHDEIQQILNPRVIRLGVRYNF